MSSAEWAVGDLAACIADSWHCEKCQRDGQCGDVPRLGEIYGVESLSTENGELMLSFREKTGLFHHSGFRRLRPDIRPGDQAQWARTKVLFSAKVRT